MSKTNKANIRKTIYLTEQENNRQQEVRSLLEQKHVLFSPTTSEAGWFRLLFEAGLQSLSSQLKVSREERQGSE